VSARILEQMAIEKISSFRALSSFGDPMGFGRTETVRGKSPHGLPLDDREMKNRYYLLWLIPVFFFAVAAPLPGANHYVRAGATGSGNGSDWTNACTWFVGSCAPSSLVRGDTYYVASGTYNTATVNFNTPESGSSVITIKKATVADHGTSTGWSDSFASGPAKIVEDASQNSVINFGSGYWVFDGQTGGGPGSWKTGFGFYVNTTRVSNPAPGIGTNDNITGQITVRHVEVEGDHGDGDGSGAANNDGISAGLTNNITFSHMYIHDQGRCSIFWRASNSTIQYSWMARNESTAGEHSEGASIWSGIGTKVSNLTFAYDVWEDIEGTGIIVATIDGMQVYGNVFFTTSAYNLSRGGLGNGSVTTWTAASCQSGCGPNSEGATSVKVYNCTFAELAGAGGIRFPNTLSANNEALNNLLLNIGAVDWTLVGTHDYNWFFNSGPQSESHMQTGIAVPFVSEATEDFHLLSHTNSGTPLSSPFNLDPDGNVRGASGIWDRGAYQVGGFVTNGPNPPTSLIAIVH
jgi:hypothetical protein